MRAMRLVGFLAMALVLARAPSVAAAAADEDKVLAKQHFESGARHFDLSEWEQALLEFKEAYRLKPDPTFLYNIAQCHRKLGNLDEALTFYRTYLRRAPDARNRNEVERRIADLEADRQKKLSESDRGRSMAETGSGQAAITSPALSAATAPDVAARGPSPAAPSFENRIDVTQPMPAQGGAQPATSIFARSWFWTAVGAVVVGGVTTVVLLTRGDDGKTFCPDCVNSSGVDLP